MKKIIQLSHVTLAPSLLYGQTDAVAEHGKVHASAHSIMEHDGREYAAVDNTDTPDVLIGIPEIAYDCRLIFEAIAQQLANDAGCTVRYTVNGQHRTVEPDKGSTRQASPR